MAKVDEIMNNFTIILYLKYFYIEINSIQAVFPSNLNILSI